MRVRFDYVRGRALDNVWLVFPKKSFKSKYSNLNRRLEICFVFELALQFFGFADYS